MERVLPTSCVSRYPVMVASVLARCVAKIARGLDRGLALFCSQLTLAKELDQARSSLEFVQVKPLELFRVVSGIIAFALLRGDVLVHDHANRHDTVVQRNKPRPPGLIYPPTESATPATG